MLILLCVCFFRVKVHCRVGKKSPYNVLVGVVWCSGQKHRSYGLCQFLTVSTYPSNLEFLSLNLDFLTHAASKDAVLQYLSYELL